MIRVILSVKDVVADTYGQPFFVPNVGSGLRSVQDEVNRAHADNALFNHSEDFILFQIGSFDDSSGEISGCAPRQVALCKELKK